jgi:hypothetical protein
MTVVAHFTISGTVSGAIADGVLITINLFGGGTLTTTTAGGGLYSFTTLTASNFPLTVVPSLVGYSFAPVSYSHPSSGNFTTDNFTSSSAASYGQQVGGFLVGI